MKVGSLVRFKQDLGETPPHSMVGVILMVLSIKERCQIQWTNGARTRPKFEVLEIISEVKKAKKD
jgi:hypothetical protein